MISVVIPARTDPHLAKTISSVLQTAQSTVEIIVVIDGSQSLKNVPQNRVKVITNDRPQGVDQCRHQGIMAARGDIVLVLDAHMKLEDGWERVATKHLSEFPTSVNCCQCPPLTDDYEMRPGDPGYLGARIQLTMTDCNYYGNSILQPKWCSGHRRMVETHKREAEIGCVLGANYAFKRERYMEIGTPWKLLTGWGWSEQLISLANWCCGGHLFVLPTRIGHWFWGGTKGQRRIPYVIEAEDVIHNQYVCALWLPMSDQLRNQLLAHLGKKENIWATEIEHERARKRAEKTIKKAKQIEWQRTLDEYIEQRIRPYEEGAMW